MFTHFSNTIFTFSYPSPSSAVPVHTKPELPHSYRKFENGFLSVGHIPNIDRHTPPSSVSNKLDVFPADTYKRHLSNHARTRKYAWYGTVCKYVTFSSTLSPER